MAKPTALKTNMSEKIVPVGQISMINMTFHCPWNLNGSFYLSFKVWRDWSLSFTFVCTDCIAPEKITFLALKSRSWFSQRRGWEKLL